ncbi:YbjN domain-containing protein [Anaeromyxobacter sp. SG26]|nr:YbjN domain-containing protein [Anaeromyxobacter sp. SG26]
MVKPVAKHYLDLLAEEGYRPKAVRTENNQSVIRFKSEGTGFLLFVDEDDETFFHLAFGYDLGDGVADMAGAMSRANDLNADYKAVKVTVHPAERSVHFHVEAFLERLPTLPVIQRSIGALLNAARAYSEPARSADQLDA